MLCCRKIILGLWALILLTLLGSAYGEENEFFDLEKWAEDELDRELHYTCKGATGRRNSTYENFRRLLNGDTEAALYPVAALLDKWTYHLMLGGTDGRGVVFFSVSDDELRQLDSSAQVVWMDSLGLGTLRSGCPEMRISGAGVGPCSLRLPIENRFQIRTLIKAIYAAANLGKCHAAELLEDEIRLDLRDARKTGSVVLSSTGIEALATCPVSNRCCVEFLHSALSTASGTYETLAVIREVDAANEGSRVLLSMFGSNVTLWGTNIDLRPQCAPLHPSTTLTNLDEVQFYADLQPIYSTGLLRLVGNAFKGDERRVTLPPYRENIAKSPSEIEKGREKRERILQIGLGVAGSILALLGVGIALYFGCREHYRRKSSHEANQNH